MNGSKRTGRIAAGLAIPRLMQVTGGSLLVILYLAFTHSITASSQADYQNYIPMLTRNLGYRESRGVLDTRFGQGGIVLTPLEGTYNVVFGLALQPDGKIVAVGPSALLRYQSDGSLDASFGGDGIVLLEINPQVVGLAVALQRDGKILVAGNGYSQAFGSEFALARYQTGGSLDTSFGTGGIVITDIGGPNDGATAIVVQPDGKIILGGQTDDPHNYDDKDFALARYNPDGSLDSSFDGDGIATLDFHGQWDSGSALGLQPDGKILMAGTAGDCPYDCFALARFTPDGSLDTSFAEAGWVTADMGVGHDYATSMALQADGKIILAGRAVPEQGGYWNFALVRYHPNGVLDLGLGVDGKLLTDWGYASTANAVTLQPDGKIIAVGYLSDGISGFGLLRYHPDGSLDATFGNEGKLMTDLTEEYDIPYAIVLQADGRILVGGTAYDETGFYFAVLRYR